MTVQRYRALVEYDGTAYFGFQRQRDEQPTIQGELEAALGAIAGEMVMVLGAGRTDSGVHARGQVVSFLLAWGHGPEALQRALNANLPPDIAVLAVDEVALGFHPRYDARRRAYEYVIYNAPCRSPLRRFQSWHVRRPLDLDRLNEAAGSLVGKHDFATFGQPPQGQNSERELFQAFWRQENELLIFYIEANAFLYRMVRSLVGSMKDVGAGNWSVAEFRAALEAADRGRAGMTAPPQGLCLVSVIYE